MSKCKGRKANVVDSFYSKELWLRFIPKNSIFEKDGKIHLSNTILSFWLKTP